MFNDLKPWHIIIIAVVFLALFGAKRLPDAARSVGKSMRIFKSEVRGMREDDATYTVEAEGRAKDNASSQSLPAGEAQRSEQAVGSTSRATGS